MRVKGAVAQGRRMDRPCAIPSHDESTRYDFIRHFVIVQLPAVMVVRAKVEYLGELASGGMCVRSETAI